MDIDVLNKKILRCKKCKGLNIPKETMSAPGFGNIDGHDLFIIGQSLHGYNPDTEPQIPFVGPVESNDSGKILYRILKECGVTRKKKNFFITNVVHCHPPENRQSTKEEIANCKSFLEEELRIVNPNVIMVLGKDAREWFGLKRIPSGKLVYTAIKIYKEKSADVGKSRLFIVAHHPSYVMRHATHLKNRYEREVGKELKEALK